MSSAMDIGVALTTTKHMSVDYNEISTSVSLIIEDIPVCVVDMTFMIIPIDEDMKQFIATTLKNSLGKVFIDTEKRFLFIGEDPSNEDTGMIVYQEPRHTIFTDDFFNRWSEIKHMFLEFKVFNQNIEKNTTDKLFCLKGLWAIDKWEILEINNNDSFKVLER